MDIVVYDNILNGAVEYNSKLGDKNYGNEVVAFSPESPTYPLTIIDEIRNVSNASWNTCFDRVSSLGYRVDIFAKTKGDVTKQTIARTVAEQMDYFMSQYVGLNRVSFNVSPLEDKGSVYHIIMTYEGSLHENRRKFI